MFYSKICSIEKIRDVLNNMQTFVEARTSNEDSIFNSRLVACELVTNILKHSKCAAKLQVSFINEKLQIIVESECCFNAEAKSEMPDTTQPFGRGLYIINTLCENIDRDGIKTTAILKI
jgi:anti-sigma regulatory factor (Ser/Thr protein kinase)